MTYSVPKMENRQTQAIEQLKNAKSQGLSYYDATQSLAKQGLNQEEIEQASYQFPYNDAVPSASNSSTIPTAANQAFAEAVVHQEAVDNAKQQLHEDVAKGLLGGRSLFGGYYQNKAIGDYAALKGLEQDNPLEDPKAEVGKASKSSRVFQRNPAVRIYAFISLIPLVAMGPYFYLMLRNVASVVNYLLHNHNATAFATIGMYLWADAGYLAYICISLLLFFARKETTIVRMISIVIGADLALFLLFAVLFKSPVFMILGFVTTVPAYWISKRVGLLMQLS